MTFLDRYLARLAVAPPGATADGLAALQQAQLAAIPFENLDPLTGRVPSLAPADLEAKLLAARRGGYCFELNGLFGRALGELGFRAAPVLARVRRDPARGGIRSHLAFVVTAGGRDWLADTGFGGPGARLPLPLEIGRIDEQLGEAYRLVTDADTGETVLQRRDGDWVPLYGFARERVQPCDVEAANFLCARWDQAPFSANLMLNRATPQGRISAFNAAVTEIRDGVRATRRLGDAGDLAQLLAEDFGLRPEPGCVAAVAAKLGLDGVAGLSRANDPAA